MTYISLFSGIEAASVAWKPMGWTPLAFAEIDAFPCAVLAHHYPGVPNHGDVTKITDEQIQQYAADVLVGGSPCQSFSVAGKRGGLDDSRGQLAIRYVELVGAARPRRVVWENVPGVLSSWTDAQACPTSEESDRIVREAEEARRILSDAGYDVGAEIGIGDVEEVEQTNDFDQFTAALVERGYSCAWGILDAQYFGVAQRRERVFLVGSLGDWTDPAAILFDRECLSGNPPPSRKTGSRLAAGLTRSADSSGNGYAGRRREDDTNVVAACLNSGGNTGGFRTEPGEHLVAEVVGTLSDGSHFGGGSTGKTPTPDESSPCYWNGEQVTDTLDRSKLGKQQMMPEKNQFAAVLVPQGGSFSSEVTHALRAEGFDASEDGTGRRTPLTVVPFDMRQCSRGERMTNNRTDGGAPGTGIGKPGDPAPSLAGSHVPAIAYRTSGNCGVMRQGEKTAALTTSSDPNATIITIPILEVGKGTSSRGQGPNGCGIGKDTDPMFTLQAGAQHAVAFAQNQRNELRTMDIAGACAAEPGMKQQTYVTTPRMAVRRLTPAECLKLQGFPPDYLDIIHRGKPAADNAKYRAIGNSMCVNVVRWIGERIEAVEAPTPSSRPAEGARQ